MSDITAAAPGPAPSHLLQVQGRIKVVVWDLDNTVWDGVLLEGDRLRVRPGVVEQIKRLDGFGVLHSIASKNDPDAALAALQDFGLVEYFLCPQIGWGAKSASIEHLAEVLNLGLDAFAFVDDQEFERAEVAHVLPQVTCVDAVEVEDVLQRPDFRPRFVTDESRQRREIYRGQLARADMERDFEGTREDFLAGLDLRFVIHPARQEDLQRAEELTVRTNQLNATGRTYGYDELDALRTSPHHLLLVASLTDRFGDYGKIGLALVDIGDSGCWRLRMLLMSCRVMSRGAGSVLLNHVMQRAQDAGARLTADFVETGRNRMMQITYAFSGFQEIARDDDQVVLEADLREIQPPPPYVEVEAHVAESGTHCAEVA